MLNMWDVKWKQRQKERLVGQTRPVTQIQRNYGAHLNLFRFLSFGHPAPPPISHPPAHTNLLLFDAGASPRCKLYVEMKDFLKH